MQRVLVVAFASAVAACGGDVVKHIGPDTILDGTPPALTNQTHAQFTFHADGDATGFHCTVDAQAMDCDSPFAVDVAEGAHTFSVAADASGATEGNPASFAWTVDTTPPDTAITSAPPALDNSVTEMIAFTGSDAMAGAITFECSLDSAAFAGCTSPTSLTPGDGAHAFAVRAVDAAGNADPSPAMATWTLDTTTPDTTITAGPDGTTTGANTSFSFTSPTDGATFECSTDGATFAACTSPLALTGLADGAHAFAVRAVDSHGVADPSPASRAWTVDATAPTVSIDSHPTDPTNDNTPSFAFSSPDPTATFACQIDGVTTFAACTSPFDGPALGDGSNTFRVHAIDPVGNQSADATFTWVTDTSAPTVTITGKPASPTNQTSGTVTFTVSDGTTQCKLDTGAFAACTSPVTVAGLADGSHTLFVLVTDTAGNTGSASATWVVDTTPPTVAITSAPTNPTNQTSATFAFTVSDGAIQCKLDTGAFATCASGVTFTGLAAGSHTFTVRATDTAGNIGSASDTWVIDLSAPTVTITGHPTNPTNQTSATFTFTVSDGTTTCQLDTGAFAACASGVAFTALADGSHTFTVHATDTAGNVGSAAFTWTVDTAPPTVTITGKPANPTNQTTATFTFTVSDGTTTCQLDTGAFASCASGVSFSGLADGSHTFTVHATDTAGNVGSASFTWTVDTTAPTVTITGHPTNPTNQASATFTFTVSDGTTTCKLDSGAFAACASGVTFTGLADGSHTFTVHATDTAGNVGSASFTWTVDTTPPTVTITGKPANPTNQTTATFTFTVSDGTTTCQLDGGGFSACASGVSFTGLADGSHTFVVRSTDTAGNVGSASFTWTVDTVAPTVTITGHPTNPTNQTTATFTFTVSDGTTTCKLDAGAFASCASGVSFSGLADGSHTFTVRSTDTAGNIGSAAFTWTVDTIAPTVTITGHPTNPTSSTTATFTFTVSDGTITCKLDAGAFASCASGVSFTALADGSHTFTVQSIDTAGNVGSASFTWTVDTTPPTLVLDDVPPADWPVDYYDMLFHAGESGVTFTCSLNGAAFAPCSSPDTITTTYGTASTFTVKAADALGNATQQTTTWTSTAGLVLHYPYEQGSTVNTSLLAQRPAYSPDGSIKTLNPVGGWAGTGVGAPAAHTYPNTIRALTSSADGYTVSAWVVPSATTGATGVIWSNQSATSGVKLSITNTTVSLNVLKGGTASNATTTVPANQWVNIAIRVAALGKGVELWINGAQTTTASFQPPVGFDSAQATDLTVGALTQIEIDDLRFYNTTLSTSDMCAVVVRGFISPAGACVPTTPVFDLQLDGALGSIGTFPVSVGSPKLDKFVADTLGEAIEITVTSSGFAISGLVKAMQGLSEHSFSLWFSSGSAFPSDTLIDFTTTCSPTGVAICGIAVTYTSPGTITVSAGTATLAKQSVAIPVGAGFHSLVVTEQRVAAAPSPTTKQLTIFVDGAQTVLTMGNGDVFATVNDTAILPKQAGTIVDEYQFWPRDLSVDEEMLCENGFDGEFDPVDGSCILTAN